MMHATKEAMLIDDDEVQEKNNAKDSEDNQECRGGDVSADDSDFDLDKIMQIEKKAFKVIDKVKKKRAKLNVKATAATTKRQKTKELGLNDWEALCKDFPVDKQIGYNLLESLLEEDDGILEESRYESNRLAYEHMSKKDLVIFFPDHTRAKIACQLVSL